MEKTKFIVIEVRTIGSKYSDR